MPPVESTLPLKIVSSPAAITRRRFLAGGAAALVAGGLYSSEWERHWISVERHEVRIRALPDAFAGFTIAQISDIHFGEFTEEFFLHEAVKMINDLRPEMVALTGDFITTNHHDWWANVRSAERCAEILDGLDCKQRFATMGNHDVIALFHVTQAMTRKGMAVLHNAHTAINRGGERMWVGGLADAFFDKADPAKALPVRKEGEAVVLLGHEPDFADDVATFVTERGNTRGADLMLGGHSHGGQIRLPLVTSLFLPLMGRKYVQGMYRLNDMQLYVNRGLGTVHLPFRWNCRPEITLLTLRKA